MSFLDNKSSLVFWSIFSLILSLIFLFGAFYFGLMNSYSATRTASSGIFSIMSLMLSGFCLVFCIFLFVKTMIKNWKLGILLTCLLVIVLLFAYFLFIGRLF